jgi:hypothetical protein
MGILLAMLRRLSKPFLLVAIWHTFLAAEGLAQRQYSIERPRERSSSEKITISTKAVQPTKGVLAIVLDPVINGQVIIKDATGRVIAKQEAGESGQAEFMLQKGRIYEVEASAPGFIYQRQQHIEGIGRDAVFASQTDGPIRRH